MEPSRVSVIVPAAGASTRFGDQDKLSLPWEGSSVLQTVIDRAMGLRPLEVLVIVSEVRALSGGRSIVNPDHARGMGGSIALGVRSASSRAAGFLIWPGDMPLITTRTARAVVSAATEDDVFRPSWSGLPGHPVVFGSTFRARLAAMAPGDTPRKLAAGASILEWPDDSVVTDLDTEAAYSAAIKRTAGHA